ncbi:exo-beta-N-acetylmuramidase NamZ family protein [Desulfatibacillum aliphaticivorans]|uniref:exo-beta-N-acetylmuramidase NamZ family protein n=1 Tax=Desulfatibacillum aliphaticivorans TaxID=218208 RepID=UPI000427DC8B|nr:DUF1343 domain-containing protein [Desulfatibacillum aliphaticivorans]
MLVNTGLDNLLESPPDWIKGKRLGLLLNPASVDRGLTGAQVVIDRRFPGQLTALFSPQHGFHAAKQDNMIESDHMKDPDLGVPIYSLYSETRIPTEEMFDGIDVLLIDIQDVGTRVYTFMYSMSYCMEVAKKTNKTTCIMDRPNPIGGEAVEGNILRGNCTSFVGRYPIPMRHGLTMAELARLFNDEFGIGCDLQVIPMTGWKRSMYYEETTLSWIPPSPNLPIVDSAVVYPGQVILEGTNVSEGRGTTRPFEVFGAPYIDPKEVMEVLRPKGVPGAILRPMAFEPLFNKWAGELCRGFQIHVTDRRTFQPYLTSLRLISALIKLYPDDFKWKQPPYEYEYERLPMDLILGDKEIREALENGASPFELEEAWQDELDAFIKTASKYHLY